MFVSHNFNNPLTAKNFEGFLPVKGIEMWKTRPNI